MRDRPAMCWTRAYSLLVYSLLLSIVWTCGILVWWNKVGYTVAAEVRDWPAMCWTIESLRARIGETQCHVRSRTGSAEYKEGKRYCIEQMTFARYGRKVPYYMCSLIQPPYKPPYK